jgi:hypothetical protein
MNGLNQLIAQGVRPVQIESPLGQMAQFEELRAAQQANVLRQRQQEEAQRQQEQTTALNQMYQQAFDPATGRIDESKLFGGMAQGGFGAQIPAKQEMFAKGREATAKAGKAETESVLKRTEFFRSRLEGINDLDGYVNWGMASFNDPVLGPALRSAGSTPEKFMERVQQAAADPNGLQRLLQESRVGVEKFAELNRPQLSTVDVGGEVETRTFQPLTGEVKTVGTQRKTISDADRIRLRNEAERLRNENQRLTLEGRRVLLAEEQSAREANPEFQRAMGAARETGQLIARNDAAAVQNLPKAVTRAEQQLQLIDQMVGTQEVRDKNGKVIKAATAPHPGFKGSVGVGIGLRFVPGTSEAGFQALYDQVKGGAFLEAYEMLKGGGAITNIEGEKGTAAITRMSLAQSEREFVAAARELQEIVRKGVERANKRVDQANQRLGSSAGAAGGGVINFGDLK